MEKLSSLIKSTNIVSVETENSGGSCMLDFITLRNDQVLVISRLYVGLYESKRAFYEGERQIIGFYLEGKA